MAFLKYFFRQKSASKDKAARVHANKDKKGGGTERPNGSKGASISTTDPAEDERMIAAKSFINCWNDHDMEACRQFVTVDFVTKFDEFEAEFDDYAREAQNVFDAMPDFNFRSKPGCMTLRDDGVVVVENLIPNGHHTGKPYAFGPCEPIEAKGTYVENAPETLYFHFRNGKIYKQIVVAHGEMTGPPGIYTQLGGFPLL